INIAIQHPTEFGLVESWSGYERADDLGSIFGHRAALLRENTPLATLPGASHELRRTGTFFWFYTGLDDRFRLQNVTFAKLVTEEGIAHRFFVLRGGHNWALWRGNATRAYVAASNHLRRVGS